jgi:hypothetical protein
MGSSYRVNTEIGTAVYYNTACYSYIYPLFDFLKRKNRQSTNAGTMSEASTVSFLCHPFPSLKSFSDVKRTEAKEKLKSIYKRRKRCEIHSLFVRTPDVTVKQLEEMYRILKGFNGMGKYILRKDGGVDTVKKRDGIGIKVDGTPIYVIYLFCYIMRLLDEHKYRMNMGEVLNRLTPKLTANRAMLFLLLSQAGSYALSRYEDVLRIGENGGSSYSQGHSLDFMRATGGHNNLNITLRAGAIRDILLEGSLEYFFNRWPYGKEFLSSKGYEDKNRRISQFFSGDCRYHPTSMYSLGDKALDNSAVVPYPKAIPLTSKAINEFMDKLEDIVSE